MGSPRMIARRGCGVWMAHICSECQFPVISRVGIRSESQKSYSYFEKKAAQIASETAEKAIEDEIRRIEACRENKKVLVGNPKRSSMISPGYFCEASFLGHQTKCPNCGNLEPWQDGTACKKAMTELEDENFPTVYRDEAEAENWAKNRVQLIISNIDDLRKDESLVSGAVIRAINKHKEVALDNQLLTSIPEKKQLALAEKQLKECLERKKQIGLLDIKGRLDLSSSINGLETQISQLKTSLINISAPIFERFVINRQQLAYEKAIAFGCKEEIATSRLDNTVVYRYTANDIPEEYLAEIEVEIAENSAKEKINEDVKGLQDNQESASVFCRKCGYKLLPDSVFCSKCGTKI